MTAETRKTDQRQLEQAMMALEAQRGVLGDAVVDAALESIREKLIGLSEAHEADQQQRKLATVLFMDIVGSTSITHGLDPEDTLTIMDTSLRCMAGPVYAYGGRVTRFMGDGFLALFGAPLARENDPEMAIRAGLEMLAEAKNCGRQLKQQWQIRDFNIRVGISTGLIIIGGESEAENTIMGATINLAARLESAAAPGTLLISDHTYQHVLGVFDVEPLEPIIAKGFPTPIQVYQVNRAKPRAFRIMTRSVAGIETRMIGRDAELLMLKNMFRDATEDAEVHVVTVVGDAGVGKSRLLHEFEKWLELLPEDIWYFKGRATLETEAIPYGLMRRMFAHRFEILESDSATEVRAKFRAGMAVALHVDQADLVGQLLGLEISASRAVQSRLGSDSFGELAIEYLTRYLRAIAGKPTVIFLEDIHWADNSSLDLLNRLVATAPDTRLLVICLTRPSLFERRPNWGEGELFYTQINLKRLSRRASRTLVGEILQKAGNIPTDLRDLIVEEAEGNPFYVEELIKMLIGDGVIVPGEKGHVEERWQIELERLAEVRTPPTLAGVLQARLDSLPPKEKMLLQRAAVVGRQFWAAAVVELASGEIGAAQVNLLLDNLRKRELIYRREQSLFEATDEYVFCHSLLCDTTYETVLLKRRRSYHAQVAQWLEGGAGERLSEYLSLIARHYELAGEPAKAVGFLRRLGEESLQVSAFREAANAFERALAILPVTNDDQGDGESVSPLDTNLAERAMLLVELGFLHNRLSDYQTAIQHLEQGLSLARVMNDPQAEIAALNRLAQVASERGEYETAQVYLGEVLVLAKEQEDLACVASTLSMLSSIAWKWGDLTRAEKCGHEAMVIYQELDNRHRITQMLNILGILATLQENYDQAESYYEQGLKMARKGGDPQPVANLVNNLGYLYHHRTGNLEKAKRCYQEALSLSQEIDNRAARASTLINLGQLHILLGEQYSAWDCLREALTESLAIGTVPLTLDAIVGVAQLQIEVGHYHSAAELLGLALGHPALELDGRQVAERVVDKLRELLVPEQLEEAMEQGTSLELDAVVTELAEMITAILGNSTELV